MNEIKTFKINPAFLGKVQAKVAALNRRAAKIGVAPISLVVGPEVLTPREDGSAVLMCEVSVSLEIPKLPGWRFLATLEHTPEGNIIRTAPNVGEVYLAAYRASKPICEHCNQDRNRLDTFVVEHESGNRKQVGRDCLASFLGLGRSPAEDLAFAEYLSGIVDFSSWVTGGELESDYDGAEGNGRGDGVWLLSFLSCVSECARRWGFRTGKQAQETLTTSTKEDAISMMFPPKGKKHECPCEEAKAEAAAAIAWAQGIEVKTDFDHNLKTVAKREVIAFRDCGIAAYVIQAYRRALEIQAERAARPVSKHFGTVGVRVKGAKLIYKGSASFDSQYGVTFIHRFITPEGDQAIWKTGNAINDDGGTELAVDYTIKEHGDWKGNLQTVLTRVKIL